MVSHYYTKDCGNEEVVFVSPPIPEKGTCCPNVERGKDSGWFDPETTRRENWRSPKPYQRLRKEQAKYSSATEATELANIL